jgi:decaprenylphospho-beta-D-ribofuranose 2-oxidase
MHTFTKQAQLSSFNRYPTQTCVVSRPEAYRELATIEQPMIARGQGCSYSDAALNENVVLTERLNCFREFDRDNGIITVEAGITLQAILEVIMPCGWFLPVVPGTQYASLGGCIAADVHGKNHHQAGSLGCHVLELELILAHGKIVHCSPQQQADIFWATIGGMGLTGVIGSARLQLKKIASSFITAIHQTTNNLEQTLNSLTNSSAPYNIAWLDLLNTEKNLGAAIIMEGRETENVETRFIASASQRRDKSRLYWIPAFAGMTTNGFISNTQTKIFNKFYAWQQGRKTKPFNTHYQDYFFPLDKIKNWNLLYGKRGFIQYQCVVPTQQAELALQQILEHIKKSGYPVFLATLKQFGNASDGMLSFPMPGFTLALDIPILDNGLFAILDQLDEMVIKYGGRVYLAKDVRLKADAFRAMYPQYKEWLAIKNKLDPDNFFSSNLVKRLEL